MNWKLLLSTNLSECNLKRAIDSTKAFYIDILDCTEDEAEAMAYSEFEVYFKQLVQRQ